MKRSTLLFLALILCMSLSAYGDETPGKFVIGIQGGMNTYYGDISDQQYKTFGKMTMAYWFSDFFAMEMGGGTGFLQAKESNSLQFKSTYYNGALLLKFKLFPENVTNFYLAGGGEYLKIDPTRLDDEPIPGLEDDPDFKKDQIAAVGGGGMSFFLSEKIAFDLEALYHYVPSDYLDGIKKGGKADAFVTLGGGLSIYLGKAKDTDRDGIPDKKDGDPYHAEDCDGFQDTDGVPDLDNDQDGIPDSEDQAKNDPEDIDGFKDKDGVPDADNDNDGVPDSQDKAPGTDETIAAGIITAEDLDGFQDEDGVPDPDNDGDGIADADDECPNEAEVFNDYQDEDGCPDEEPDVGVKKGEAIILEGVTFASGSAQLTANSKLILDKVVKTMADYPDIEVEIRGYTDNTGSYQGNVRISQMRADAVRSYLIERGIGFSRIKTMGFGPENPIAPNNTREGRARNRRIEFFRIK